MKILEIDYKENLPKITPIQIKRENLLILRLL